MDECFVSQSLIPLNSIFDKICWSMQCWIGSYSMSDLRSNQLNCMDHFFKHSFLALIIYKRRDFSPYLQKERPIEVIFKSKIRNLCTSSRLKKCVCLSCGRIRIGKDRRKKFNHGSPKVKPPLPPGHPFKLIFFLV